jgi:hypothetical protein
MERFPNEVDNILTKDVSSFQEVKNKFLNLHSASGNDDSAQYTFSNKKNKSRKREPNSLIPALQTQSVSLLYRHRLYLIGEALHLVY